MGATVGGSFNKHVPCCSPSLSTLPQPFNGVAPMAGRDWREKAEYIEYIGIIL